MRPNNICQIRNIFWSDQCCWGNIEKINLKRRSSLTLVVWQYSCYCDQIYTCSNRIWSLNFKFWMKLVEINHRRRQLRYGRNWINCVPKSEYFIAYYWREGKIRVEICLFWIVNNISLIIHWVCEDSLIAAQISSIVHFCLSYVR